MGASIQGSIGKRAKGYKGGIANSNPVTTDNSTAEAVLGTGKFCKVGTTGHVPLSAIADVIDGVLIKSDVFDGVEAQIGDAVTICKGGDVYMYSETACAKGGAVHVRCIVNGNTEIGNVLNVADGINTQAHSTAKFGETLASAGLVKIVL